MGHQRSSGMDDSTELSSDVEGGNNDYEDLEYENDADQTANEGLEKKRAQRYGPFMGHLSSIVRFENAIYLGNL